MRMGRIVGFWVCFPTKQVEDKRKESNMPRVLSQLSGGMESPLVEMWNAMEALAGEAQFCLG